MPDVALAQRDGGGAEDDGEQEARGAHDPADGAGHGSCISSGMRRRGGVTVRAVETFRRSDRRKPCDPDRRRTLVYAPK